MAAADWLETAPVPAADVFLAELPQAIMSDEEDFVICLWCVHGLIAGPFHVA